jgi:hypothetical protein
LSLLKALLGLVAALGVQVAVAQVWPDTTRFTSLLLVLVALYGVSESQRSAMLVGCLAGLLHDAWLQAGAFGATGFKWTLLGWLLGSIATRLDLDHPAGRFGAGIGIVLGDGLLNVALVRLLDQPLQSRGLGILVLLALLTGLLAAMIGSMVERKKEAGPRGGMASWRRI